MNPKNYIHNLQGHMATQHFNQQFVWLPRGPPSPDPCSGPQTWMSPQWSAVVRKAPMWPGQRSVGLETLKVWIGNSTHRSIWLLGNLYTIYDYGKFKPYGHVFWSASYLCRWILRKVDLFWNLKCSYDELWRLPSPTSVPWSIKSSHLMAVALVEQVLRPLDSQ